jgi:hypothetical protein
MEPSPAHPRAHVHSGFHGPVEVRARARVFELTAPLTYTGARDTIEVPAGFVTDFASVPRACSWLIPTYGTYTPAAVVHDWLCEQVHAGAATVSRRDADGIFRRSLRELGVSWPRRWLMWAAVRVGSRMSGAPAGEWAQVLTIAVLAVPLLGPPVALVQGYLVAWWGVERVTTRRPESPLRS